MPVFTSSPTPRNAFTDPALPAPVVRLFGVLCGFDRGRGCWASRETLARLTGLSLSTINHAVPVLAERGYITVTRRKDLPAMIRVNPEARKASGIGWPVVVDPERERLKAERQQLKAMLYDEYLQTDQWKKVRKEALSRADFRCQLCNRGDVPIDVHHRTYERRGQEKPGDVVALCRDCHSKFHGVSGGEKP